MSEKRLKTSVRPSTPRGTREPNKHNILSTRHIRLKKDTYRQPHKGDFKGWLQRRLTSEDQLQSFNTPGSLRPGADILGPWSPRASFWLPYPVPVSARILAPLLPGPAIQVPFFSIQSPFSSFQCPFSSVQYQFSSFQCPFSGFRVPFSGPWSVFDGFCMHFGCHVGGNFQSNVQFCCNVTKPSKCF